MTINVTSDHIHRGRRLQAQQCPVALAIPEMTGHAIYVCPHLVYVYGQHEGMSVAPLPEAAQRWIFRYDQGEPVEPFSFDLEFRAEVKERPL